MARRVTRRGAGKPIVFEYKRVRGHLLPLIPLGLRLDRRWYPLEAYVDSGATYTLFHAGIAEGAGFDYRAGRLIYVQVGDGSSIPTYLHRVELQIGDVRLSARVGFSEKLGVGFNLLGRADVFSQFEVCFDEPQRQIRFTPVELV